MSVSTAKKVSLRGQIRNIGTNVATLYNKMQSVERRLFMLLKQSTNVLLVVSLLEQKGLVTQDELVAEQKRLKENAAAEAKKKEEEGAGEDNPGLPDRDVPA